MFPKVARISVLIGAAAIPLACGSEEAKYEPRPAYSGAKASLPSVPTLQKKPIKQGEAYTVWGAAYYLRSNVHRKDIVGKDITVTGYITKTNLMDAPECAVHKTGKADPEGCKAPVPTFWIGDSKDAPENESIKVMGWASNFANLYDAIQEFDRPKDDAGYDDQLWGVKVPNPLPAKGAKVTVKGKFSTTFMKASSGAEADPYQGIIDFQDITVHEPAAELATLPTVKRKPAN
ncbi:MAG TPA: hypothetical protein VEX18_02220 [Polyangiaceae bacterium]|nr:hypothetical protein [Polyangiaceae bacterium]